MKIKNIIKIFMIIAFLTVVFLLKNSYAQSPVSYTVEFVAPGSIANAKQYEPPILGVLTHFGSIRILGYESYDTARNQLDAVGATSFRDGIAWSSFSFPPNREPNMWERRRIIDFLPVAGRSPLLVLGSTSIKIPAEGMPFSDEELAQFSAYVSKTVDMTRSYSPIYEVWNEYNMMVGHELPKKRIVGEGDATDVRAAVHYAKIANLGVAAVKKVNRNAKVVVGAVGEDPDWEWTQAIVRYGALDGADGLSIHLYNHCLSPQKKTAREMIDRITRLQNLLRTLRGGIETPLYVTEYGWPTSERSCSVTQELSAYNFAQFIFQASSLPWIKGAWIYELKNESLDPKDVESNFGLFDYHDKPKPAVCFVREASKIVREASRIELKQPIPDVFVLRATMKDKQIVATWTTRPDIGTRVNFSANSKTVGQMCTDQVTDSSNALLSQAPTLAVYELNEPVVLKFTN